MKDSTAIPNTTAFPMPISEQIWDMKYRLKDANGDPIDETVEDTWRRIAKALAAKEHARERNRFEAEFYEALEDWKFVPAGRIVAGAGTGRMVTLFNCFVMGTIPDSMDGIFSMLREAALTMQQGGGIGYDFTPIRPKTSRVKKLGADASGPLSFMDCWDAMCRTVMSAGSRRGAMMATMSCDHPDIEDYITAKQDAAKLRMFNLSVLATDDFMYAVDENLEWHLCHVEPPALPKGEEPVIVDYKGVHSKLGAGQPRYLHKTVKARDLWNLIMQSTYDAAEPGVIFIDRINQANNLNYVEKISSTNPCGEQPLPPYGACLLGSINLVKMAVEPFTDLAHYDEPLLRKTVRTAVRMMDNVVDVSNYPLEAQKDEAHAKRRIGLGVTGLADLLVMLGYTYGTEEAAEKTQEIMRIIDQEAYTASTRLAEEKGPFPLFDVDKYLADGHHVKKLCDATPGLETRIRRHGIRNALLTSIAPTGTISLYAGNVSSGIEPIFAYGYNRKVLKPDGTHMEERVEDYAVAAYREHWEKQWAEDDIFRPDFVPEEHLPSTFVTAQDLEPADHVRMQAAAQHWVDSSISKTVNLPEDISFAGFKAVYWDAYESGCKGCTTYRPNDITGSVLSVDEKPKEDEPEAENPTTYEDLEKAINEHKGVLMTEEESTAQMASLARGFMPATEELPERPEALHGTTYKVKVGDQKAVYLTVNDKKESDGTLRPFEIFLRSSDPTNDEWMVAVARTVSAVMRRPYGARFIAEDLKRIHSSVTGGFVRGGGYQPSLLAAIGTKLIEHMDKMKITPNAMGVAWPQEANQSSLTAVKMESASIKPGLICKDCGGYNIQIAAGCPTCMDCGWSKCS